MRELEELGRGKCCKHETPMHPQSSGLVSFRRRLCEKVLVPHLVFPFRYAHEQTRFQRGNFPLLVFFSLFWPRGLIGSTHEHEQNGISLQSNGGLHSGFRLMDRSGGVHSGPITKPSVSGSNSRKSLPNFITVSREIS